MKELFGKQIPSKYVPLGIGEPLEETKNMLEDENDKKVHTITRGTLKKKEMTRKENDE